MASSTDAAEFPPASGQARPLPGTPPVAPGSSRDDELAVAFRRAESRLREVLFGDGVYSAGTVRGDERRGELTRNLKRMREAFEALLGREDGRAEVLEERITDLEQELRAVRHERAWARWHRASA